MVQIIEVTGNFIEISDKIRILNENRYKIITVNGVEIELAYDEKGRESAFALMEKIVSNE
jgi:hypothetical protein